MASKGEVQKRLTKLIRSMESHLANLKMKAHVLNLSTSQQVIDNVSTDIEDFEEFFAYGDNESMKG